MSHLSCNPIPAANAHAAAAITTSPINAFSAATHTAFQSTASNTATPATAAAPATWLRLAEYGDWPHPRGLQRFTPAAAQRMVGYFKSLRGRLARKFGGLPVYIGHPDDAHFSGQSGHTDTRSYAWVTDIEARRDGLYGAFKWSPAGADLLGNAFYKFLSPRWVMEPLGKDAFQPVRLLSVGLTNQPNIPGEAIANSVAAASCADAKADAFCESTRTHPDNISNMPTCPDADTANSEIPDSDKLPQAAHVESEYTANSETPDADDHEPEDHARLISYRQLRTALGVGAEIDPLEAISELREQSERFYRIACEQSEQLNRESASLSNARREQIGLVVQNALLSGRIAPHETQSWEHRLEADWSEGHAALCARTPQMKTTAIANTRPSDGINTGGTGDFLSRVEAHAKANDLNFAQAWCDLKRRQPELYQHFFATGNLV